VNSVKRALLGLLATLVIAGVSAQGAWAHPTYPNACSGCHGGSNVAVTATLASVTSTTAVYNVSAPTGTAIAIFNGSTKVSYTVGTTAQYSVAPGKTYTIYSVKGPTTSSGLGQTSVSPVAPSDTTPPATSSNAAASYTGTATITLTAADTGGSGVAHTYYKLDAAAQVESRTIIVSSVGTHTIEFWSVDVAGNTETPHKTATFRVNAVPDTTAPVTTSDALPSNIGTTTITLTAVDTGGSGVAHTYYRLDAAAQVESRTIIVSSVGTHTIEFWSVDVAGNTESPHKTVTFSITAPVSGDRTAPTTTSNASPYYTGTATITLTARDNTGGSGVAATYYSLDGAVRVLGTTVVTAAAGAHTLEFWSEDKAANEELPHKTVAFSIDPVAPTTTSDAVPYYLGPATVTLLANDNAGGSGVSQTYYKLDGAPQVSGRVVTTGAEGAHTLEFWSVDVAGNAESPHKTVGFRVDTHAPTTSSDAASAYNSGALIHLVASDGAGSGIAHTYYRLDGGSATEGTSVSVLDAGTHTLEFWSVDAAGNVESPHQSAAFTIDLTAPTTFSDAALLYTSTAAISLTATDTGVGVDATYYRLDGGAPILGAHVEVSSLGNHALEYWSCDKLGNEELPHKTVTFRVRPVQAWLILKRSPNVAVKTVVRKKGVARYSASAVLVRTNGMPYAGARVVLQMKEGPGYAWESMYTVTSSASGRVSKTFSKRQRVTMYYRWYLPSCEAYHGAASKTLKVAVK
jgi:hypothetical protein